MGHWLRRGDLPRGALRLALDRRGMVWVVRDQQPPGFHQSGSARGALSFPVAFRQFAYSLRPMDIWEKVLEATDLWLPCQL